MLNYDLIAVIDEVGILADPFRIVSVPSLLYDRLWLESSSIDRGFSRSRYTGEKVYLTEPIGFGSGTFGSGLFGWS